MNLQRPEIGDTSSIRFDGQVAIVTGAGSGLGRCHALALAARGAALVVNDSGMATGACGGRVAAAEQVAAEIRRAGGLAIASTAAVTDPPAVDDMVALAVNEWGRVDILVNHAGVQRDKTFTNLSIDDFRSILEVHLMGAFHCTKSVWEIMKAQRYGRIVMGTSYSGLFGSFGQSNDGAAKMALVGLMQSLAIEAQQYGIRVNCLAPTAAPGSGDAELTSEQMFTPESVSPGLLYLVSRAAPTKTILCAGGGAFSCSNITLTDGVFVGSGPGAADSLAQSAGLLCDREGERIPPSGIEPSFFKASSARYAQA